jgi:hypothetical protein
MFSIHLINFKHNALFMELDYGFICYERLAIRWFSIYVGDIYICFIIYCLMLYLSVVFTVFGDLYGW